MLGLTEHDFIEEIEGTITIGEFYGIAAGSEITFT
jgi:hypothetical protein